MVNKISSDYECPFDIIMLNFIDTHLSVYHNFGLTPNIVTTISLLVGILAAYCIYIDYYMIATILFITAYYLDCVDGKLARKYNMATDFGDYYDHFSDLFKVILILFVLQYKNPTKYEQYKYYIYILFFLSFIHLGYQEIIYNGNNSPSMEILKLFTINNKNAIDIIKYTRLFGLGTTIVILSVLIYNW